MSTPNKTIPEFIKGNTLAAAPLESMRQTLVMLVREWEANFGALNGGGDSSGPAQAVAAVRATTAGTSRFGILNGTTFYPNARPTTGESDLVEENLVAKATEADTRDAEVWDVSTIGLRMGQLAGYNDDGKPIFLVDGRFAVMLVRVTGNADGGGVYTGEIYSGASSKLDPATTLSSTSYGNLDGDRECYVLNAAEEGQATHDLTTGTPISKTFVGVLRSEKATDGKPVVTINGFDVKTCAV